MRKLEAAVVALVLAAPIAADGLAKYKGWADSPEAYFLSRAEREQWLSVETDAAAEKFVAAYKDARGKGFAAALQSRIDGADKTYTTKKVKGARTAPGRTLILLGSPSSTEKRPAPAAKDKKDLTGSDAVADTSGKGGGAGSTANSFSNVGGPGPNMMRGIDTPPPGLIRWLYQGASVPPGAGVKELTVEFEQDGAGNVTLKDPAAAEAVFQKVIEYWAPKAK